MKPEAEPRSPSTASASSEQLPAAEQALAATNAVRGEAPSEPADDPAQLDEIPSAFSTTQTTPRRPLPPRSPSPRVVAKLASKHAAVTAPTTNAQPPSSIEEQTRPDETSATAAQSRPSAAVFEDASLSKSTSVRNRSAATLRQQRPEAPSPEPEQLEPARGAKALVVKEPRRSTGTLPSLRPIARPESAASKRFMEKIAAAKAEVQSQRTRSHETKSRSEAGQEDARQAGRTTASAKPEPKDAEASAIHQRPRATEAPTKSSEDAQRAVRRKVPTSVISGVGGAVGERFGRYLLFESLGSGGMAQVFRAVLPMMDEQYGKTVAIKRILPCFTEDQSFVDLLIDEARLTLRLNHPNVAQTFELGKQGEHFFMAMEYVDGPSLADLLRAFDKQKLRFPIDLAIAIAMQAASGLFAAHELHDEHGQRLGVVHRDVSPQNLLIDRQGIVKLIDFGVAKAHDRIVRTMDGAVRGRLSFFSPERAAGDEFDHRADLFALGLLLWMMLTGAHPHKERGQVESLLAMQSWKAPSLRDERPEAPAELEAVLHRVLATDPNARHRTGEELRGDLSAVLHAQQPTFSTLRLAELVAAYDDAELGTLTEGRARSPRRPLSETTGAKPSSSIDAREGHASSRDSEGIAARARSVPESEQMSNSGNRLVQGAESSGDASLEAAEQAFWGAGFVRSQDEPLVFDERGTDDLGTVPMLGGLSERPTQMQLPRIDPGRAEHSGVLDLSEHPTILREPEAGIREWQALRSRSKSRASLFLMLGLMVVSAVFGALVVQLRSANSKLDAELDTVPVAPVRAEALALAEVELKTKPARAEIAINGEPTGSVTPAVLALPPGEVEFELWLEGYEARIVSLELSPGGRKVVHLDLLAAPAVLELSVRPETTLMVEVPSLQRRYLLSASTPVRIDGLRQGEEVELLMRKSDGVVVRRLFTPRSEREQLLIELDAP